MTSPILFLESRKSVSYTHLDVYKRQLKQCRYMMKQRVLISRITGGIKSATSKLGVGIINNFDAKKTKKNL